MNVVRGCRLSRAAAHGGWEPSIDARRERVAAALETAFPGSPDDGSGVIDGFDDLRGRDVAIVPDAAYPFHPSTGMVTDPAVVGALAAHLEPSVGPIDVVGRSTEHFDADRSARYLGYPSALNGTEAAFVDVAHEGAETKTVDVAGETVTIGVPDRLLERTVVVVPTLRPTADGAVAGAARTLGAHVAVERSEDVSVERSDDVSVERSDDVSADLLAAAAIRTIEPAGAVVDGTIAFAGEPYAARTLFAGDAPAVDAVAATLLDRDPSADRAIVGALDDPASDLRVRVRGLDLEALRSELPSGDLPPPKGAHPAVDRAYRLYAAVAGDAVPPQMAGGGDE